MFKKKSLILVLSLVLVFTLVVGCAQQSNQTKQKEQKQTAENVPKKTKVVFGHVQWPGVTVKTHVVKQIWEYLGYDVKMNALGQQMIFKGMDNDEIDAFYGNWMPTMKVNFEPYQEKGTIVNTRINLDEALYQTAVPEYVWEAGVKSMADLHKYPEKFEKRVIGIEPGNDGNAIIKEAIKNNTYQLQNWELVPGSTAAMLSAVAKATKNKEWIAFNGWKPHWMNVKFDLKYLKDPEGIWGGSDEVYTAARPELEEEMPNFWKFLEQFKVNSKIQSAWILEYQKEERPAPEISKEWIKNNLDIVEKWVDGVVSADGKQAIEVIRNKVKQ